MMNWLLWNGLGVGAHRHKFAWEVLMAIAVDLIGEVVVVHSILEMRRRMSHECC